MENSNKNLVSVLMLTYKQEQYIEQALSSIVVQKTNFSFNIVIGDDHSTDKTLSILKTFKRKYPKKIKLYESYRNFGVGENFCKTVVECDGKYIAICDGDDYWVDDHKLQKQVNYLEYNPDYSMVFTNNYSLYSDGKTIPSMSIKPDVSDFRDMIKANYIASVTVLYRNIFHSQELPKWLMNHYCLDWISYLMVLNTTGRKVKYLNTLTAVYRKDIGVSANLRKFNSYAVKTLLSILEDMYRDRIFKKNKPYIYESILTHRIQLMNNYNKEHKYIKSVSLYTKLFFKVEIFRLNKQFFRSLLKGLK